MDATPRKFSPAAAIALATLVAGALDIGYAIGVSALRGATPTKVLQSVASGLLGKASYDGGAATALLGFALHFAMMALIVLAYFVLSRRFRALGASPWLTGPLYGLLVFCVMNYVVVPLSAIGHVFQRQPLMLAGELFSHVVFVGLSIALIVGRAR
jgi:uncharacterized membrane protein YagU involved in acid resistance